MADKRDDVGPAPIPTSLRDYFAGQALRVLGARPEVLHVKPEDLAKTCYAVAEAMLAERTK